jgi:predicted transcriptional regulator
MGELERAVMDRLWAADSEQWFTVREVHDSLAASRDLAYTTVMTVMDRLARKELISRERDGRAWRYRARAGRSAMTAELLRETLDDFAEHDHRSALVAFVEESSADDVAALREALARLEEP